VNHCPSAISSVLLRPYTNCAIAGHHRAILQSVVVSYVLFEKGIAIRNRLLFASKLENSIGLSPPGEVATGLFTDPTWAGRTLGHSRECLAVACGWALTVQLSSPNIVRNWQNWRRSGQTSPSQLSKLRRKRAELPRYGSALFIAARVKSNPALSRSFSVRIGNRVTESRTSV
jgi:hypothetical protein